MKKKLGVALAIIASSLLIIWVICRATNMLQYFKTSAISNYPTLKQKQLFFTSNLVTPKRFDFIAYSVTTADMGAHMRVFRVCGVPGDKLEIKNGVLYVNGENADINLPLAHYYYMTGPDYAKLNDAGEINEEDDVSRSPSSDSLYTYVSDKSIMKYNIKASKLILPADFKDAEIKSRFGKDWNQDNFGPVYVLKNKYFVMGDNRQSAQDSRYLGFVDEKDVVGTLLGVK
jgi:signal peptidase I